MSNQLTTKVFFQQEGIQSKFKELLGKRSSQFITSVMQVAANNDLLKKATNESIYGAAITAAVLDLPIQNNLGFAYIVPYKQKINGQYVDVAQFQLGYKGYIQLAQRSGQFKRIDYCKVYESDTDEDVQKRLKSIVKSNPKTNVVGYASYFELINGFEAHLYMSIDELKEHAGKYSQTYKKGFGVWADNFESMAIKTVLKLLIAKFAPLSIEMQQAITFDQSVTNDGENFDYVDNQSDIIEVQAEEIQATGQKLTDGLFEETK